jgi:hypothetical protein
MEDCPSTTSDRDFEKIGNYIITHSDTVEGPSRGYAAFCPTVTRTVWCSTQRNSGGGR